MSARCVLLALPLLAAPGLRVAWGAGEAVFAGTQVHTIAIDFAQPAWWDSLTYYYAQGEEQYLAARVTLDGAVLDSVGVRFKGNITYYHPNGKKPFRLKFNEFVETQRWDGLNGVHLNNCWEDPTFMREKLHLDLCRDAGIPAPRGSFAELYLNGDLWGFYSLVEHVDNIFLSSRYGENDGNRYKAVDALIGGGGLISDFKWYGSDSSAYVNRYELKTEGSPHRWVDLIAAIDSLNNAPDVATALPPVVNLRRLYRASALDILLASLDCYAGSGRNFYVYFAQATGRMEWIPWDVGMSFGSYWGAAQNYETLDISYVSSAEDRPLLAQVHATPELEDDYRQAFCGIFQGYFSAARLFPAIDELADLIRPYVYADPRKMYTSELFEINIVSEINEGGHRKPGLKDFITAREANIVSQLTALGVSCEPVVGPGEVVINEFAADNTIILDPVGEDDDWIEFYNNTTVEIALGGMFLTDDPLVPDKWSFPPGTVIPAEGFLIVWADNDEGQPGLHASFKLSADGEFLRFSDTQMAVLDSVTFGPQTTNRTMARIPNGTGPFVPSAPTFNAHNASGSLVGFQEVVLNEFMADNDSIPDPAGEPDDWIELYNTTDHEINLGGLYLSDRLDEPTKWQFPLGTTISTDGYLLVWADEDLTQPGVHASFKLSAAGEEIILSNTDLSVVDSTSFGQQITNRSMARIPNGSGPFIMTTTPTPGGFNTGGAGAVDPLQRSLLQFARIAPNPLPQRTQLEFSIPRPGQVALGVYDPAGRLVASLIDRRLGAGTYRVDFNAADLPSGAYLCRLAAADAVVTQRLLVVK